MKAIKTMDKHYMAGDFALEQTEDQAVRRFMLDQGFVGSGANGGVTQWDWQSMDQQGNDYDELMVPNFETFHLLRNWCAAMCFGGHHLTKRQRVLLGALATRAAEAGYEWQDNEHLRAA
jgi:hypothetical protein